MGTGFIQLKKSFKMFSDFLNFRIDVSNVSLINLNCNWVFPIFMLNYFYCLKETVGVTLTILFSISEISLSYED